ncbi:MAG TPA: DUF1972 domain-containing protein, partial [Tepidisphaeraceae bacterium]|nr:DUF1972 domain-containing protein [Tepidisphaeraceae bacterium]
MRIAILGTRGVPANYGGFETFAEELSARLAARGHDVSVFCRRHYAPREMSHYRGVRLLVLPAIQSKHLDTVSHSFLSALYGLVHRFDGVLVCNAANSFCCGLLALRGTPTVLNVDGIERKRRKWGRAGRAYYRLSEWLAVRWATRLVSDAEVIREYYRRRYQAESSFIPYGFSAAETPDNGILDKLGVAPREYYLYVSRLEPENNADVVIKAHAQSGSAKRLLIVGSAPYARKYVASLQAMASPGVLFCGPVYGPGYHALQAHAYAYIQATEVGGTHPALVEAMGYGNLVLANDTPENREVLADAGLYYARNNV